MARNGVSKYLRGTTMKQTKERLLHHVTITVFCKPYDTQEDILRGLDAISPVPTATLLQQDKEHDPERPATIHYRMRGVRRTPARGFSESSVPDIELTTQQTQTDDGPMMIYTLFFKKMSAVNRFARQLLDAMTASERESYQDDPAQLLDYEGKLSVRLDKELLKMGKLSITDDGNCYQVKAAIAAYPKNEEQVLATLGKILA